MRKVTVTVSGPIGAGKTSVAAFIARALREHNWTVNYGEGLSPSARRHFANTCANMQTRDLEPFEVTLTEKDDDALKTRPFVAGEYLIGDSVAQAAFLEEAFKSGDEQVISQALQNVSFARHPLTLMLHDAKGQGDASLQG